MGYLKNTFPFFSPLSFFGSKGRGLLLPWEFFCFFLFGWGEEEGEVEEEGSVEVVVVEVSFLLIASLISFLICCSRSFWFDWVVS